MTLVLAAGVWFWPDACLYRGRQLRARREHQAASWWLDLAGPWTFRRADELTLERARVHRRLGELDEAERLLARARELQADPDQLEREQLILKAQRRDFTKVSRHWTRLFQNSADDGPEISKAYVEWCLSQLRLQSALRVLDAWALDFSQDPDPHFLRAQVFQHLLRWSDATDELRVALELDPDRNDIRLQLGRTLMRQMQLDEARRLLAECFEQSPAHLQAALAYTDCLIRLGRIKDARDVIERALPAHPDSAQALHVVGKLELMERHPRQAAKLLEKAWRLKPEDHTIRYSYAQALSQAGEVEQAAPHFRAVKLAAPRMLELENLVAQVSSRPRDLQLRMRIAEILWHFKSREEATAWFRSIRVIDPRHEGARAALNSEHKDCFMSSGRSTGHSDSLQPE